MEQQASQLVHRMFGAMGVLKDTLWSASGTLEKRTDGKGENKFTRSKPAVNSREVSLAVTGKQTATQAPRTQVPKSRSVSPSKNRKGDERRLSPAKENYGGLEKYVNENFRKIVAAKYVGNVVRYIDKESSDKKIQGKVSVPFNMILSSYRTASASMNASWTTFLEIASMNGFEAPISSSAELSSAQKIKQQLRHFLEHADSSEPSGGSSAEGSGDERSVELTVQQMDALEGPNVGMLTHTPPTPTDPAPLDPATLRSTVGPGKEHNAPGDLAVHSARAMMSGVTVDREWKARGEGAGRE
ncbi:hypothetical protein HDU93_005628 [Gonapodya sp. JEL0774]|nr:hypothetical protein HDU93_005628 [Gonapodya sp. JEL0774]